MNIYKYAIITLLAVLVSILVVDRFPPVAVIVILCAGYIHFIRKWIEKCMQNRYIFLFLFTFLIQITFSLSLYNKTVDTKYYGFSYRGDDYVYGDFGMIVGNLWRDGKFPKLKELEYYNLIGALAPIQPYQLYNAFIFYLFGSYAPQIILIVNCFLHSLIIIPVYFLCKRLKINKNIITFVSILFLFWPSTFYTSLFNFKEPMKLHG